MANEKLYTAKQATLAILAKVHEVFKKSDISKKSNSDILAKTEIENDLNNLEQMFKGEGYKPQNSKKENAKPSEHDSKDADQHADGPAPKGEIHPKESEQAPKDGTETQKDPMHNPKEQAEGNNELAGTTPTQVGQDGKNKPGGDEIKGHLKLAKFVGRMDYKRQNKQNQAKVASQEQVGSAKAQANAQHKDSLKGN